MSRSWRRDATVTDPASAVTGNVCTVGFDPPDSGVIPVGLAEASLVLAGAQSRAFAIGP